MKIEIFDSTLREGAQTPNVFFTFEQKKFVLAKLAEIGIDFAEIGYPASSTLEFEEIKTLVKLKNRPTISVLGRCIEDDIQKGAATGAEIIDIDWSVSPYQLDYLKITLSEAYEKAESRVNQAVKTGKRIKFAALDFARTPIEHLLQLYKIASKSGAEWFTLCDTVGVTFPDQVEYFMKKLTKQTGCKIAVHFHNDFDMATANTITAARFGAKQLELTINGLGDRAGIAPMLPVVCYLKEILGYDLNINIPKLVEFSKEVSRISKIDLAPLDPLVGDYCFKHNPGIHIAGIIQNNLTFEPLNPEKIGLERSFTIGRYTGKHAVAFFLKINRINLSAAKLDVLVQEIKKTTMRLGRNLKDSEIVMLADQSKSKPR